MTPPSYTQSQQQYNQPPNSTGPSDATYVPPYSEHAQPYDAGYYDQNGVFHSNKGMDSSEIPKPDLAHTAEAANFERDFPHYFGGANRGQSGVVEVVELEEHSRPEGAPPTASAPGDESPEIYQRPSGNPFDREAGTSGSEGTLVSKPGGAHTKEPSK